MLRTLAIALIAAMGLPAVMTTGIILRFQLDRERIVREVCVQRNVPEKHRTCHGQCHLMKQLQQQEAPANGPTEPKVELRVEPAINLRPSTSIDVPLADQRSFGPDLSGHRMAGHRSLSDPVPWC